MKKSLLAVLMAICILFFSCSKSGGGGATPTQPADTKLRLTISDASTSLPAAGALVGLYATQTDWTNLTNPVATAAANSNGEVTFSGLQSLKYYWYIKLGCLDNTYEATTTTNAIPLATTTSLNVLINKVGGLGLNNTSTNPYRVYVDGNVVISSMPGNSTAAYKIPAGAHSVRVLQLSGYVITPTDLTYSIAVTCGGVTSVTFP